MVHLLAPQMVEEVVLAGWVAMVETQAEKNPRLTQGYDLAFSGLLIKSETLWLLIEKKSEIQVLLVFVNFVFACPSVTITTKKTIYFQFNYVYIC